MSPAHAQERISKTINSNWLFMKGDTLSNEVNKWTKVSIPHTWNADDVMDDESGYYRGEGWYKKTIYLPRDWKEKEIYIYFEGAAQVAEVFVNGKQVGKHTGSYTAFSFPINKYLNYSEAGNTANELMVKVNNSHDENIPPLSGDYTFLVAFIAMCIWLL
jgi:beta-galactosidase